MSTTTYKSIEKRKEFRNEVVIQITKKQLITFFGLLVLAAFVVINYFAITTNSPLLTQLIIVESIMLMIAVVKYLSTKSN